MKIYIAGKITGIEAEAYELFLQAENAICHAGHVPLNPMKRVDQEPGRDYNEYLLDALRVMMLEADAVLFLDNWIDSKGARIEFAIANELDMTIYSALDEVPIAQKQTASSLFGRTPLL